MGFWRHWLFALSRDQAGIKNKASFRVFVYEHFKFVSSGFGNVEITELQQYMNFRRLPRTKVRNLNGLIESPSLGPILI